MEAPPKTADLSAAADISLSYASEIVNGKRQPSRPLAIHIFRKLGWKHESIAELTEDQIAVLEQIEPWTPPKERQDAAA